jgi:alpha-L-rhamnosidase
MNTPPGVKLCFLAFALMLLGCGQDRVPITDGRLAMSPGQGKAVSGPAQRAYQAQWIWGNVASPQPFQFVRFRKTVELAARPARATVYITADTFYRLWINGQLAMHGPARSSRGKATVDPVEVGHLLIQGRNTLMIEVFHGVCAFEALAQAPGLLCELEADFGGRKEILAATDATWEASDIAAWSRKSEKLGIHRGWLEQFDARGILKEKSQPAIVLGKVGIAPWQKVEMRDIPLPAPLAQVRPVSVIAVLRGNGGSATNLPGNDWHEGSEWYRRLQAEQLKADPTAATNPQGLTSDGRGDAVLHGDGAGITCDLGRGYVGFISFEVSGNAGQHIEIVSDERLPAAGAVRPSYYINIAMPYILREGRQSFLAFMPGFCRYLRISHRGAGDVTVHRLGVTEFRFAAEPKGDFACSDPEINRIYQAARWTAAMNTLDAYMDCPHRERNAMYGVEGYWMQKAVYPMFGDTSVSRRSILYGADSATDPEGTGPAGLVHVAYPMHLSAFNTVIPTQPLFWVLHAGLYERCSGDTELIRAVLPAIRRNLAAMDGWRNSDGLLESIPGWMFFDYAAIRTDGVSVALNGVYARTLDEAARLERLAGDATHAEDFTKQAKQVRDAINRYCPGDTFYPDVLLRNEKKELAPSPEACETTQDFVLWGGVPSPERQQRLWTALRDDFLPTPLKSEAVQGHARAGLYPFSQRLEVAARLGDHAALLRDAKAMFLPMVDSPPGTLWEDATGAARFALCHSIACGVGGILTEEVLGIRLGFPLKITPHNGGTLRWCKGFITTPKGRVQVAWESQKDRYQLQASIPKGITAEVVLPPEAKAVWQSAPAKRPWQETVALHADATIIVRPGYQAVK